MSMVFYTKLDIILPILVVNNSSTAPFIAFRYSTKTFSVGKIPIINYIMFSVTTENIYSSKSLITTKSNLSSLSKRNPLVRGNKT